MKTLLPFLLLLPFSLKGQEASSVSPTTLDTMSWAVLLDQIDTFYYHQKFQEALPLAKQMLSLAEKEYEIGHENHIESVFYLGIIWRELGEYKKALPLFEQTVALTEQYLPKGHERYPYFLEWLPELYTEMGQYEDALVYYQKALQYAETVLGKENEHYIANLGDMAIAYNYMGKYDEAIDLAKKALKITSEVYGKNDAAYIIRLSTLAQIYDEKGAYQEAENLYQESIELAGKILGKDHPDYSYNLNNLAILYYRLGDFEKAIPLFKEDLDNTERLLGKAHSDYLAGLNNLGALYYKTGQYERTLPIFQQIIALSVTSLGENHPKYISRVSNLASLYYQMGQYENSLPIYLEVLSKQQDSQEKNPNYAKWLNNVAVIYKALGQWEKAQGAQAKAINDARENLGTEHLKYISRLDNLAKLFLQDGKPKQALPLLEEAHLILDKTKQQESPEYREVILDLGDCYLKLKDLEKAIPFLLKTEALTKLQLGERHPKYSIVLDKLARYYELKMESVKAETFYQNALKITGSTLGKKHPKYGERLNSLALFYRKEGRNKDASTLYLAACKNFQEQLNNYYPALSEGEQIQFLATITSQINQIFSLATTQTNISKAIQNLYLNFKGLALERSIDNRKIIEASKDSLLIETFYQWQLTKRRLASAYTLPISEQEEKGNALDSLLQLSEQLEGAIARQSSQFNKSLKKRITFQDLKNQVKSNQAIIDILHFPYHDGRAWTDSVFYYALVTTKEQSTPAFVRLAAARSIQKITRAKVRKNGSNYIANPIISNDLYQTIWLPLIPYLKNKRNIQLSPSGLLHQIAFDALRTDPIEEHLLMDQHNINYYSNLRDLFSKNPPNTDEQTIALVGGANYDLDSLALSTLVGKNLTSSSTNTVMEGAFEETTNLDTTLSRGSIRFNYLPGTLQEVQTIEQQFNQQSWQTTLLTGENALEETVVALSGKRAPKILHLATHGYFFPTPKKEKIGNNLRVQLQNAQNPLLRSGLVFSGVNYAWKEGKRMEGLADGALTAYEIANMDLSNTHLVVLSACQTGLGTIHNAEGVFGLQRAFKTAGVDKMIISLWKVSDKETSEFMQLFYQYYLQKKGAKQAFKEAQIAFRKKLPAFYWGAFVLIE